MKRVLALILTVLLLAGLFPASIVAQAETVTKKPFYCLNFDRGFDTGDFQYVYWTPYTWINKDTFNSGSEYINIGLYFSGDYSTADVDDAAAEMYDEFRNRPAGTRVLDLSAMQTVFTDCVRDAVDMEDGVRLVREWLNRLLDAYQALGGVLDGIIIDLEYNYAYNFYVESHHYTSKGNKNIYNEIVANKVYKERIRPKLVELEKQGYWKFYENPNPTKYPYRSEIWTMYRYDSDGGNATCRSTWDTVIQQLLVEYINEATYEPLIAHYPNAILSDYNVKDAFAWNKAMTNTGGATGNSVKAGNASDGSYYNTALSEYFFNKNTNKTARTLYYKPAGHNDAVYTPENAYSLVLYDINTQKRILASTQEATPENKSDDHVTVHVAFFNYGDNKTGYHNTPYYSELMYHFGMTNPEQFQGYILERDVINYGKAYDDPNISDFNYALKVMDELMAELTRVAGASDRKPILTPIAWNEDYILSGMYAGGRNIWRITPNTDIVSLEAFKVKDTAPTFQSGGLTITFPQGRIIEDSKITQVGSCGYWVETPANVTPVVTSTEKRYAENPSFEETFSRYTPGAFTGSRYSLTDDASIHKDTYWTATGTAEIVENGGNKAISLAGTTTLTNDKIPANITAGDKYATQQAWEVTVTVPVSGAYTQINLLDFVDSKTTGAVTVGGFTLSDGQVKYNQNGAKTALSNVDIGPGGTYTFKRVLDFRTAGAYTGSYYVYDASGKLLGSAENVKLASAEITLPAAKITMATTGASEAVVIDDYKLYPLSLAADLDIYDANTGRKIADVNTVRSDRTAYRLSWMNATGQYKVARIYDVKSGTILKKVEMAPGMDGVVTGIVDAGAGKPVQIAVDVQDGTAPSLPDYDAGNFRWTAVSESLGLATGPKPAGGDTGSGDTGNGNTGDGGNTDTPNNGPTEGTGEEGGNIYDIIEGTPEITPDPTEATGSGDGNDTPDPDRKKGLSGGIIALIVVLSVAALGGAGVAVYIFVVKPKLAAKSAESEPKETSEE